MAFKLDAHTHFAARVRSADIEETPLNSSHRRRRTKAKGEVTRGSRKLKPITPPLKGKGLHTLLFLMRPFPHGVLDTSAESIPNFETKNKLLTYFQVMVFPTDPQERFASIQDFAEALELASSSGEITASAHPPGIELWDTPPSLSDHSFSTLPTNFSDEWISLDDGI